MRTHALLHLLRWDTPPGGLPLGTAPAGRSEPELYGSLLESFFIQRHPATGDVEWLGSLIVWLLIAASVVCIAWIIKESVRARTARRRRRRQVSAVVSEGGEAYTYGDMPVDTLPSVLFYETETAFTRALNAALTGEARPLDTRLADAEQRLTQDAQADLRRLEPLNIAGNVAPMVGLFGTVYGMILAFRQVVIAGGTPEPVALAAGIGTALTTTFWGLVVAVPALTSYGLLRSRLESESVDCWKCVEDAVTRAHGSSGSAEAAAPAGAAREEAPGDASHAT